MRKTAMSAVFVCMVCGVLRGAAAEAFPPLAGDGVSDDTAAIQARLDSGIGCVYLPPPAKCYLISKTLKIGPDQELRLDRFSVVRLAPGSDCPMVENRGYEGGKDRRIALTGGIWDMANLDQSPSPTHYWYFKPPRPPPAQKHYEYGAFLGIAIRFSNVEGITVRGLTLRNPTTYGIAFCKTSYFRIDDITFDYTTWNPLRLNLDGVHLDGHCHHGKISNLRGTCYDDLVALNANDGRCAQEQGPISDVDIDGIYAEYCHSAVRLLSAGADLERVTIRNVHGNFYTYAVGLTHFFPKNPRGHFDDIVISDVFASKVYSPEDIGVNSRTNYPPIWVQGPLDVGSLTIRNLSRDEKNIAVASIRIDEPANVKRLTVRDCKVVNRMDKPLPFLDIRGMVETATVENNMFVADPGENTQTTLIKGK